MEKGSIRDENQHACGVKQIATLVVFNCELFRIPFDPGIGDRLSNDIVHVFSVRRGGSSIGDLDRRHGDLVHAARFR